MPTYAFPNFFQKLPPLQEIFFSPTKNILGSSENSLAQALQCAWKTYKWILLPQKFNIKVQMLNIQYW